MPASDLSITLDASHQSLGRFASTVAHYLRGKHRPGFSRERLPMVRVRVTNIRRLALGPRQRQRPIHHFSGYPGGLSTTSFAESFQRDPDRTFRRVVRRMLPANRRRRQVLRFLSIS